MKRKNNGYGETKERQAYLDRYEPRPLPIEGDTIQIGKYRGQKVERVRVKDPGWFKWACENVRDFQFLADN